MRIEFGIEAGSRCENSPAKSGRNNYCFCQLWPASAVVQVSAVEVVILQFGQAGDFHAMRQIASATDGAAYQILNPIEVGKVFIEAIARRI